MQVLKSIENNDYRVEMSSDGFHFKVEVTGSVQFEKQYDEYVYADIIFDMLAKDGAISN